VTREPPASSCSGPVGSRWFVATWVTAMAAVWVSVIYLGLAARRPTADSGALDLPMTVMRLTLSVVVPGILLGSGLLWLIIRGRLRFSLRSLSLLILLATGATGLCFRSGPWQRAYAFSPEFRANGFSADGKRVRAYAVQGLDDFHFDAATGSDLEPGEVLYTLEPRLERADGAMLVWSGDRVFVSRDGSSWDYPLGDGPIESASFSPRDDQVLVWLQDGRTEMWYQRRPMAWWGILWLWEFWLTAALAGALAWSLIADRRRLRASPPQQA